ncbi:MAG: hypothetical protein AB1792_07280 [Candidatus Zixiibacteriota bacterium]
MSRESFISDMQTALARSPALRRGQPGEDDLQAYFATLRGDPDAALAAYREYAASFYVHIAHTSAGAGADVSWPGGACDRWSELVARPSHQHRRIIDCEGFAYIAAELLPSAGWTLLGYAVIYLATTTDPEDFHMVAVLEYPGATPRRVYIGSERTSTSWLSEANAVFPQGSVNARSTGVHDEPQDAIEEMQEEIESGAAIEVAPLTERRSHVPELRGE